MRNIPQGKTAKEITRIEIDTNCTKKDDLTIIKHDAQRLVNMGKGYLRLKRMGVVFENNTIWYIYNEPNYVMELSRQDYYEVRKDYSIRM